MKKNSKTINQLLKELDASYSSSSSSSTATSDSHKQPTSPVKSDHRRPNVEDDSSVEFLDSTLVSEQTKSPTTSVTSNTLSPSSTSPSQLLANKNRLITDYFRMGCGDESAGANKVKQPLIKNFNDVEAREFRARSLNLVDEVFTQTAGRVDAKLDEFGVLINALLFETKFGKPRSQNKLRSQNVHRRLATNHLNKLTRYTRMPWKANSSLKENNHNMKSFSFK
jgi:hypothetical protein